jgi:hypothetical protein
MEDFMKILAEIKAELALSRQKYEELEKKYNEMKENKN